MPLIQDFEIRLQIQDTQTATRPPGKWTA